MKTRLAVLVALVLTLCSALLLNQSGAAQRGRPPAHAANPPRANGGRIPTAPPPRSNPSEQRQTERLPTGHVNDTPHVNHNQWFGHEPANDARFHLDHPFQNGRFAHVGPAYRHGISRFDAHLHRFWFVGGFYFDVALWDWPICEDWCWDCGNDFVIYDDADHVGWYVLYNVHTGAYVHVQYMGM